MATKKAAVAANAVVSPSGKSCSGPCLCEDTKAALKTWLKGRVAWNHQDWESLLSSLQKKGLGELTKTAEGRTLIGNFLESNRKK